MPHIQDSGACSPTDKHVRQQPVVKSRVKKQRNPHRYRTATRKKSKLDTSSPVTSPKKERPSLRNLVQSESPEKRPARKGLWVPEDNTPQKRARKRLRDLDHISSSGQEKARDPPASSWNSVVESSAEPTGSFASMTSLSAPSTVSAGFSRMSRGNTKLNCWKVGRLPAEDASQTPSRERKALILPDESDEELLGNNNEPPAGCTSYLGLSVTASPLSSPPSNLPSEYDFSVSTPTKDKCGADKSQCPTCHEPVDQSLLDEWIAARPRFDKSSRDQAMFCNAHQRETAKASYKKRGYPDIDWASLPKRVKKLDGMIGELLGDDGTSPDSSIFAKEYAELVKSGRERTLLQASTVEGNDTNGNSSCGGLSPGYYGPRAVAIIDRDVMKRFAGSIRRKVVQNALLSVRGKTMFIYRVVVPAVVARLVMKDLSCDFERAREVMAESAEIGRLVSEDLDDDVHVGQGW